MASPSGVRRARSVSASQGPLTFAEGAEAYTDGRNLTKPQRRLVAKLVAELGHLPLAAVRQAHLVQAASRLYPNVTNATRNRLCRNAESLRVFVSRSSQRNRSESGG